jgi:NADH-quinone oxidoreductase subunit F
MNIEHIRAAAEACFSNSSDPSCIKIYVGSSADDSIADSIAGLLRSAAGRTGLNCGVVRTGSFGLYDLEPIVALEKPGCPAILYGNVTPDLVDDLVHDWADGKPGKVKALCCIGNSEREAHCAPRASSPQLFALQNRIVLRNCGWIDPEDINHYVLRGQGYAGLSKTLRMKPAELIEEQIPLALMCGRGPGGSTADKWKHFAASKGGDKCLICNAIDSDPRSLASRLLLESDPHSVLEGMLICAYAAGATSCFILVEENLIAGRRLRKALDQMSAHNLLGSNILDTEFCAEIKIEEMPESLTTGYRIELFRCLEEKQPLPHVHPGWPAAGELIGKTVFTASPEAMSRLSAIFRNDAMECSESRVVTLSGSVAHKCTVEVSPEMTVRGIIENFGGGASNGKAIKAIQIGGPAGRFIGPDALDLSIGCAGRDEPSSCTYSSSVEVFSADTKIVDAAKDIMAYLQTQSCGKCVFCREGCLQLLTILEDISENRCRPQDLDLLIELGEEMLNACLCDFGRAAPNPILSSIRLFNSEYEKRFPL